MRGGKNKKPQGYTIIEVLIVMAISSMMFLLAAVFVSGKQTAVQFTQAVNDLNSRLQATIQEVADGEYPALNTLGCTDSGGSSLSIQVATGPGQGYNNDCVFLGKVVAGDGINYKFVSVAGRRKDPVTGQPVKDTNPLNSIPTAIASGTLDQLVTSYSMEGNVPVTATKVIPPSGSPVTGIYGIGFLTSPTGYASASGSGTQTVGLYYLSGLTSSNATNTSAIWTAVNSGMHPANSIILCIDDGGSRQAAITLGVASNQLTSTLDRTGAVTCS